QHAHSLALERLQLLPARLRLDRVQPMAPISRGLRVIPSAETWGQCPARIHSHRCVRRATGGLEPAGRFSRLREPCEVAWAFPCSQLVRWLAQSARPGL